MYVLQEVHKLFWVDLVLLLGVVKSIKVLNAFGSIFSKPSSAFPITNQDNIFLKLMKPSFTHKLPYKLTSDLRDVSISIKRLSQNFVWMVLFVRSYCLCYRYTSQLLKFLATLFSLVSYAAVFWHWRSVVWHAKIGSSKIETRGQVRNFFFMNFFGWIKRWINFLSLVCKIFLFFLSLWMFFFLLKKFRDPDNNKKAVPIGSTYLVSLFLKL